MDFVRVGVILKPFGLKGMVKAKSLTSFPMERFKSGNRLFLCSQKEKEPLALTIADARIEEETVYLSFEEVQDVSEAEKLRGASLELPKEEASLPDGYYRLGDLLGLIVYDAKTNAKLGQVSDVLDYAPTKTLQVEMEDGKRFYVPFLMEEFISSIDLENKTLHLNVIEGLLP